ncbi:MAG TPA: ParB N-terminal domain-containing protein [Candidatus Saccharimonadales bacterium]|nr:ParB N-terminal domain-containing protein [Candidatus Saccharimonadales bacterium]
MSEVGERSPHTVNGPSLSGPMARWLAPTSESRVERIAIAAVHDRPWWPGTDVDAATLAALRASIASRGIIEPLLLRRRGADRFEVVCGSRRLRAARELGQTHVPAIVRELSEREALLVAAWTTVERRQHTGDRTALSERLLAAGFTQDETRVLSDQPSLQQAQPAARANAPTFVLRPDPLSRPRRFAADIAFELPRAEVLPAMAPEALTAALTALEGVSLVALAR